MILSMLVSLRAPDSSIDRKAWLKPVIAAMSSWRIPPCCLISWHMRPNSRSTKACRTSGICQMSVGTLRAVGWLSRLQPEQIVSLLYRLRRHRQRLQSRVPPPGVGVLLRALATMCSVPDGDRAASDVRRDGWSLSPVPYVRVLGQLMGLSPHVLVPGSAALNA